MSIATRRARVKALAKINLSLEVLNKRSDGYHNIRTVFQTVSIADTLDIEFTPSRKTSVTLETTIDIPDNLVVRAANALSEYGIKGQTRIELYKRIPMGGGLGGGSTDAAAVLLALPALARVRIPFAKLVKVASGLGSDVPFFLLGGTALGLGRGTELYPLASTARSPVLIITPDIHVSTPEAYRALARTSEHAYDTNAATSLAAALASGDDWQAHCVNDFEKAVFAQHPRIRAIRNKLVKLGATEARLSGSGASVFGIFSTRANALRAAANFPNDRVFPVHLVDRAAYHSIWRRQLSFAR